jgi:hypothetical protein
MKVWYILLVILFAGCVATKEMDNSIYLRVSNEPKNKMVDSIFFKSSRVIRLETNENSLLKAMSKICCDDGKLFVFDNSLNKIVVFDMNGKYITNLQNIGAGPREYEAACDFCLDTVKKQILLLCDRPYKVIYYDYLGHFVKEIKLGRYYRNIAVKGESVFMNSPESTTGIESKYELHRFNADLKLKESFFPVRKNITSIIHESPLQLSSTKNVYFTRRFDNSIYMLGENGIEKEYEIDFNNNSLSELMINGEVTTKMTEDIKDKKLIYSIYNVIENDSFIIFKTNLQFCVYDKQKRVLDQYRMLEDRDLGMSTGSFIPIGNRGDMIACELQPSILSRFKTKREELENKKLLELVDQVDVDDNPVLILKEFR